MKHLSLRLPDELLAQLRESAEHDRRSLNSQIIHILDGNTHPPRDVKLAETSWHSAVTEAAKALMAWEESKPDVRLTGCTPSMVALVAVRALDDAGLLNVDPVDDSALNAVGK